MNDCEMVDELSKPIKKRKVKSVRGDGAYDTEKFYQIIHEWRAKALIPPAVTSKAQDVKYCPKKKAHLAQRDKTIKFIRKAKEFSVGLNRWKKKSGYHRRSLVESCMLRIKRIFGFYFQPKTTCARRNEIITKINLLNKMASLGMPAYT